jgi:Ca2+/Na+ antiporter
MNFDYMPELRSPHGYFITLAVMLLITVILLIYFWRRGWIFQKEDMGIEQPGKSERENN